jgi:hypothetical protein
MKRKSSKLLIYSLGISHQTQSLCFQQLHRHGQHEVKVLYPIKKLNKWILYKEGKYHSLYQMEDKNMPG